MAGRSGIVVSADGLGAIMIGADGNRRTGIRENKRKAADPRERGGAANVHESQASWRDGAEIVVMSVEAEEPGRYQLFADNRMEGLRE